MANYPSNGSVLQAKSPHAGECAPISQSGYTVLVAELDVALNELQEAVGRTGESFEKALRPEPPCGTDCLKEPTPVRADIEAFLSRVIQTVRGATGQLQSYRNRCCL
jgi:hypothetical protein